MSKAEQRKAALQEFVKNTTTAPGVYQMLDKNSKIIYVGKAKNLRNRLRTYLHDNEGTADKTRVMMGKVHKIETILTDSEAEALILECILIKKHKPKYNILLKDDKSYPYLQVDYSHTFPKIVFVRRPRKKKDVKVFGPFASAYHLRSVLRFLNQSFQLRDCSDAEFTNRSRPCMNFQIGQCSAPCTAEISAEGYQNDLKHAIDVLQGRGKTVINAMYDEMDSLAEEMKFEQAARLRDQVAALKGILEISKQKMSATSDLDKDVIGFHRQGDVATIACLFVRKGDLVETENFHFQNLEARENEEVLFEFLAQFYLTREDVFNMEVEDSHVITGTELKKIPQEIVLPFDVPDHDLLKYSLSHLGHKVALTIPKRGNKQEFVQLAEKNAEKAFEDRQREQGSIYRTLADLKARLRLTNYPRRMECFDISNLGDTGIVASQVTFIEGKPDKSQYRHYKIRSTSTQNDFAAMREVLERRLVRARKAARSGSSDEAKAEIPDLIVVDGGRGQLSMAVQVMKELDITGIDLVSLAKSKTKADVEALDIEKSPERVFKPGRMNPIALAADSPTCHLMARLRDEAHRFAITFQRKQRKIK